MKAARIHQYGSADVIRYEEAPRPTAGPGEVLIRVAATSFNPSDIGYRSGAMAAIMAALPYTLGTDVAGTITEVGSDNDARPFAVADQVIGRLDKGGGAAEYVAAAADLLVRAPTAIPLADAAAVPVAALTAWQALFEHAHISAGQHVLINGAGGGVGAFTVQLAADAGAEITATASPRSAATVRRYGAHRVIDYTATPVADAVPDGPIDAVINLATLGQPAASRLASHMRAGSVIVSITHPVDVATAGIDSIRFVARNDIDQLAKIVDLIDAGKLVVDVTETHPLRDIALVHRRSEAGQTRGKITILP